MYSCSTAEAAASQFTAKERDAETGLDYFGARYFSGAQGRFTSPNAPLFDQHAGDPQSWNLYSYVRNNPLRFIDPTGSKCVNLDTGGQGDDGLPGASCPESAGLNTSHGTTVSAVSGNAVIAFGLNFGFELGNYANNFFRPLTNAMGVQPSYMQNIPPSQSGVGKMAMAAVFVADFLSGKGGPSKLLSAATRPGRGGLLTKVGRALQKHAGRPGSSFPSAVGPEVAWNQKGLEVLKSIIEHPGATVREIHHPIFGNVVELVDPAGRGARFSADMNTFIGFLEP